MKDFDKKYDPEKYAKNLDKVELDVAKKTGDSYDKAQKKALDAINSKDKDIMKGDTVPSSDAGKARYDHYVLEAKNNMAHRQYYGNKGYGTGLVIVGAKGAYIPTPLVPVPKTGISAAD